MKASYLLTAVVALHFFAGGAFAQKKSPESYMVEPAFEAPAGQLFDEASYLAGTSILNQFANVIVVNKAAKGTTAQTMRMFSNGIEIQLPFNKVSTGREDVEIVKGLKKTVLKIFGGKGTTESHWRHTTRGFYSVKRVEGQNYQSGESKFHMPYAVFFNDVNGLALHEVPWEFSDAGHAALGSRASSGCIRVHKNTIPGINDMVRNAGKGLVPVINTKTGLQEVGAKGNLKTQTGWRSIVIVQEVND
jgi:lipoprotein-anchoring transpeptidase ErfK/SrfK